MLAEVPSVSHLVVEKFSLGRLCITPGAETKLAELALNPLTFLARHASGDWGQLAPRHHRENTRSLARPRCLCSVYELPDGDQLWIRTEADRSATTMLLPDEA